MPIDWACIALTSLVIFLATLVQGIAGFGLAQVSMGLLPLFRSPSSAYVIFSLVAVVSTARVWWSVREDFRWKDWAIPAAGLAPGLPLGVYLFSRLNETQLRIAIAITLFVAVILIAAVRQLSSLNRWVKGTGFEPGWKAGVLAGFLSGVLGGAVAIPGPPIIVYGALLEAVGFWNSKTMKAVFTAFFATLAFYRVIPLAVTGAVSPSFVMEALIALPALFLGAWAGISIFRRARPKVLSWIVLGLLTANATILLITSLSM
jgi:uncharacterized membrane protein YfcA